MGLCFEWKIRFHITFFPKEWERMLIAYFKQKQNLVDSKGEQHEKNNRHNVGYP